MCKFPTRQVKMHERLQRTLILMRQNKTCTFSVKNFFFPVTKRWCNNKRWQEWLLILFCLQLVWLQGFGGWWWWWGGWCKHEADVSVVHTKTSALCFAFSHKPSPHWQVMKIKFHSYCHLWLYYFCLFVVWKRGFSLKSCTHSVLRNSNKHYLKPFLHFDLV